MTIRAAFPQATGDPVLRVLVHGTMPGYEVVPETVFAALQHFGIPYRVTDLGSPRPDLDGLARASGVLIAQEGLGSVLGPSEISHISRAMEHGAGVFNLDGELGTYDDAWWRLVGLRRAEAGIPCVLLRVVNATHPITAWRTINDEIRVKVPVRVQGTQLDGGGIEVLLDTGKGTEIGAWGEERPALIARTLTSGRIVQSLVSPRIWRQEHVGHGNGLSDIFWRSILWTCRRPFVAQAMPPFVTTRLDNATGAGDGFRYVDALNRHGYIAALGLYLRRVREKDIPALREKWRRGLVECSAHSFDDDSRNLIYGRFDLTERAADELQRAFEEVDSTFQRWRIAPARVVNAQWGVVGFNSLPYLRQRAQTLLMKPLRTNRAMYGSLETINDGWKPRPFGSYEFVMDSLPEASDFYVASVQLPRAEGIDCLQGCPTCHDCDPIDDLERAAQKAARGIQAGLRNLFFGCLLTHESRVYSITSAHWEWVLNRLDQLLEGWPRYQRGYDEVATYARARDSSYISYVEHHDGGLAVALNGESDIEQYLYLYQSDATELLEPTYCPVPAFTGSTEALCNGATASPTPGTSAPPTVLSGEGSR